MSEMIDLKALTEPFPADAIGWKAQSTKDNRALAVAYIDARDVMDRLDAVVGIGGWQDDYTVLPDGNVVCRLSILVGGEWITKQDVGGESDQKDEGDKRKSAFSDALKRAAIKWGVGRYLYRLPAQWVDYDPQRKQLKGTPRLPDWALPSSSVPIKSKPATKPVKRTEATTGKALVSWLDDLDAWAVKQNLGEAGDVREAVVVWVMSNRWPEDWTAWDESQVRLAMSQAKHVVAEMQARKKAETAA